MFKRTVWFTIGSATGLASSYWVQRRVKQAAAQLPERVQREVTDAARRGVGTVRAAASEGRQAMADRQAELQAHVDSHAATRQPPRQFPDAPT